MSTTILEALHNAEYNYVKNKRNLLARIVAEEQLHNAITLLDKGYGIHDEVEPLLEKYGGVDQVPHKEKESKNDVEQLQKQLLIANRLMCSMIKDYDETAEQVGGMYGIRLSVIEAIRMWTVKYKKEYQ